jgi:hypothetical protein
MTLERKPSKQPRPKNGSDIKGLLSESAHVRLLAEMRRFARTYKEFYTEENNPQEPTQGFHHNYNSPLWEFQNQYLEHQQPHPTSALYAVIMHLGDIFRGCADDSRLTHYPIDKFRESNRDIRYIHPDKLREGMTEDRYRALRQYLEKLEILQKYTISFPREELMPGTEDRKRTQLAALTTIKQLTDWTLQVDPLWDDEATKAHIDKAIEIVEPFHDNYLPTLKQQLKREMRTLIYASTTDQLATFDHEHPDTSWNEGEIEKFIESLRPLLRNALYKASASDIRPTTYGNYATVKFVPSSWEGDKEEFESFWVHLEKEGWDISKEGDKSYWLFLPNSGKGIAIEMRRY